MTPPPAAAKAWLDMDQAALDKAYDQAQWAPNMAQVLQRFASNSEWARAHLGSPMRHAYGPDPIEALDFFDCGRAGAPVLVFLHGGAWRSGRAHDYAFLAEPFVRAGVHVAIPDFSWVQDCGGDLPTLAGQVRRAIAWVQACAVTLRADAQRLFLAGHSSGAHLAAVAATTDWTLQGLPADLVKGTVLCSGLYELEPVRRSSRSRYIQFEDEGVHALSPIRHLAHLRHPLVVGWGTLETPEFQRQGREFAQAARARGLPVTVLEVPHCNHFEILETLASPYGLFGRAALEQALRG